LRYLADESVDRAVVSSLRESGYEVAYVSEISRGAPDSEVLQHAQTAQSVLLTADKDFGELVFRKGATAEGVVLLRLSGLPQNEKASVAVEAFQRYAPRFVDAFTVIQRGRVRIRRR
jgi:predicted nuclease of predicted toxin-antitoxin system